MPERSSRVRLELNQSETRGRFLESRTVGLGSDARRFRVAIVAIVTALVVGLILATLSLGGNQRVIGAYLDPGQKIEAGLQLALASAAPEEHLEIIVHMQDTAQDMYAGLPQNKLERRFAVAERLQQTAAESQSSIRRELHRYQAEGGLTFYRSLWIIDAIQIEASRDVVHALAARPDVARVSLDAKLQLLQPVTPAPDSQISVLPWHLERTRVRHVWAGLGISGTGSTIAVMDTGADWQHTALIETYAGFSTGGSANHELAWFDAVEGNPEPFDPHGHGTHVIGTASGREGIGVAPGSRWMAVRILGPDGSGQIGDIHAGFQWLLAPDNDPSLSPDIVSGSWSGPSTFQGFLPDIEALHAAGILTVFAAGNAGPELETIRTPAAYPGVIAVGATDDIDEVAWFSSRGPSGYTSEAKPTIVAPGIPILSALPGNRYGYNNGTSMATPHIAGIAALILSADPTLSSTETRAILTASARPIGPEQPDHEAGWGLADAYAAVSQLAPVGTVRGTVNGDGMPLPGASITITTPGGSELPYSTDADGAFEAPLISGTYDVAVSAFAYAPSPPDPVMVTVNGNLDYHVDLARLPHGVAAGRLVDDYSGLPLPGTLRVSGTPSVISVADDGVFSVELPVGSYELVAWVSGYRLSRQQITISAGSTAEHELRLRPGPRILLVDSGQWYGQSHRNTYGTALQENDLSYTVHTIRDPYRDRPTIRLLAPYDVVVWSSPGDSPSAVGSVGALTSFLDKGGKLFISGQNVAQLDDDQPEAYPWWHERLGGLYLGSAQPPYQLQGEPGSVFEGTELQLLESDSGGALAGPDAAGIEPGSLTQVGLRYADGRAASLLADRCEPFHIAYFAFGLEQVPEPNTRRELVSSTFDFFAQPETEVGLLFDRTAIEDLVMPGMQQTYSIELLNLSQYFTDTYQLTLSDADWPANIITETVEIGPCQVAPTAIEISVPESLPADAAEQMELVAKSSLQPEYQQRLTVSLKVPGRTLLVDDDRWYDQSATFKAALDAAGISYDFWENSRVIGEIGGPPDELLNAYNFVIWYTGYDWFRPVTGRESEALSRYLAQGGRLFLTSQDYLYYHRDDPLTRDYLGVRRYAESITPTIAYGVTGPGAFAEIGGPHILDLGPYRNNGDGLIPHPGAHVSLWHDAGYAAGLATAGADWRTVFWAIPMETLPEAVRTRAMSRIMGWLGDLGETDFIVDSRTTSVGVPRTYTLTLRNSPGGQETMVSMTNTLPISLALDSSSISGGAAYSRAAHQLTWSADLQPGEQHQIAYRASPTGAFAKGELIENRIQIHYDAHDLRFERTAPTWIDSPDLTASRLTLTPEVIEESSYIAIALTLLNEGSTAGPVSVTLRLLPPLKPETATLALSAGDAHWSDSGLSWSGRIEPGTAISAAIVVSAHLTATQDWLPVMAILDDGLTDPVILTSYIEFRPPMRYFPLVAHKSSSLLVP